MKRFLLVPILTILGIYCAQAASPIERLNKNGVALCEDRDSKNDLNCYDAVSYFQNKKPEKVSAESSRKFRAQFKEATYVFVSQEHLDLFTKSPESFLPQFGGWCAYAVATKKEKIDIDPKSFHIQDGKLLLFYDGFLADTRKIWLNDKKKDPKTYFSESNTNWPTVQNKEP